MEKIKKTLYLSPAVEEQLRRAAFEARKSESVITETALRRYFEKEEETMAPSAKWAQLLEEKYDDLCDTAEKIWRGVALARGEGPHCAIELDADGNIHVAEFATGNSFSGSVFEGEAIEVLRIQPFDPCEAWPEDEIPEDEDELAQAIDAWCDMEEGWIPAAIDRRIEELRERAAWERAAEEEERAAKEYYRPVTPDALISMLDECAYGESAIANPEAMLAIAGRAEVVHDSDGVEYLRSVRGQNPVPRNAGELRKQLQACEPEDQPAEVAYQVVRFGDSGPVTQIIWGWGWSREMENLR